MVFLFRSGPLRDKLWLIFKATRTHARNLAMFALVYKSSMLFLQRTSPTGKELSMHTFLAGLTGGYLVFGRGIQSSVNQQIVIYVFARVMLALAKIMVVKRSEGGLGVGWEMRERIQGHAWPVFASLSWAMVMWIFRWYPDTIQPSLKSSMNYMSVYSHPSIAHGLKLILDRYVNSNHWDSFRNFLVYNK